MRVVGGKRRPDGKLGAFITEVAPDGAAVVQGSLSVGRCAALAIIQVIQGR
jgi:hypothetical protein